MTRIHGNLPETIFVVGAAYLAWKFIQSQVQAKATAAIQGSGIADTYRNYAPSWLGGTPATGSPSLDYGGGEEQGL